MKSLRRFFIPLLLVGWLVTISPDGLSVFSDLLSPTAANCTPANAPWDGDDSSDSSVAAGDCALTTRRLGVRAPVQTLPRHLAAQAEPLSPALGRIPTVSFAFPHVWQFVQRAAAAPRAPSALV